MPKTLYGINDVTISQDMIDIPLVDIRFEQVNESKNLSQLLRSNAAHFWKWADFLFHKSELISSTNDSLSLLKKSIQFEGIITGDPHLGNFSISPVFLFKSSPKKQLFFNGFSILNIDWDDAGLGPFILDFVKLTTTSFAAYGIGDSKDLINQCTTHYNEFFSNLFLNYIKGLSYGFTSHHSTSKHFDKGTIPVPDEISKNLNLKINKSYKTFAENRLKQLSSKISQKSKEGIYQLDIKSNDKEMSRLDEKTNAFAQIISFFSSYEDTAGTKYNVADIAIINKRRGGSADSDRYFILAYKKGIKVNDLKIKDYYLFELKQWNGTALSNWNKDINSMTNNIDDEVLNNWYPRVQEVFSLTLPTAAAPHTFSNDNSYNRLYSLPSLGNGFFWFRSKSISFMEDVPYEDHGTKAKEYIRNLAIFDSWYLGFLQGRQKASMPFIEFLSQVTNENTQYQKMLQSLHLMTCNYLDIANSRFSKKSSD